MRLLTTQVLPLIAALCLFVGSGLETAFAEPTEKRARLVLAGPSATVSFPLLHLIESGALADLATEVEFMLWNNPDQLRALALDGQADFMAMPTNVAANLYNRGVPLQLMNVSVWGMLWMVSRNPQLTTLADFKGEEIALPFRGDMPDIVFRFLAEKSGLDPLRDFKIRYSATPMDAMQLLVMRRVDHALLAEPAVSMALRKTQSFPLSVVAPDLYRSVNLQEEWGRLLSTAARIPQAGLVALGDNRLNADLMAQVEAAYAQSNQWCLTHTQECAALAAKHIRLLTPEATTDALNALPNYYATAAAARSELEDFFQLLLERQPAAMGNSLPDAAFYAAQPTSSQP